MAKVSLRWFRDIHSEQKGELGEAIAKAYVLEKLRENPERLHTVFADLETRVYDSQFDSPPRVSIKYADSEEDIEWIPDFQVEVQESISFEERERRREAEENGFPHPEISKDLYAEVKTSKSRSYPSDKISQNQARVAQYLASLDDTIVISVMVTLGEGEIGIHTYQATGDDDWEKIEL